MNSQDTFAMTLLPARPSVGTVLSREHFEPEQRKLEPFVVGQGSLAYNCGGCGHTLLRNIRPGQVTKAVYKCPKCGKYNQIELPARKH